MKDSNTPQSPTEVQAFIQALKETKTIATITEIVEQRVQQQLESHLLEFQQTIAQSNAVTIELMQQELQKLKDESSTVQGALQRLSNAIAPNIPANAEVVTFREAIHNLQTCGSILPSDSEILTAQVRMQQSHAWSLFRQAVVKLLVKKMEELFCKQPTSTERTGTTKDNWE
nr:hypothetical protein [Nostoc sp. EkiNYC01]